MGAEEVVLLVEVGARRKLATSHVARVVTLRRFSVHCTGYQQTQIAEKEPTVRKN
jgi:hypothetical protein